MTAVTGESLELGSTSKFAKWFRPSSEFIKAERDRLDRESVEERNVSSGKY